MDTVQNNKVANNLMPLVRDRIIMLLRVLFSFCRDDMKKKLIRLIHRVLLFSSTMSGEAGEYNSFSLNHGCFSASDEGTDKYPFFIFLFCLR